MSSKKRGGIVCSYKNCKNAFNCQEEGTHFFRFPKDENLCRLWLQACGREDLSASEYLHHYKTRRVCSKHFEDQMYMGPSKTRLLLTAVPKRIESDTNIETAMEHGECSNYEPPTKRIRIEEDITGTPGPSFHNEIAVTTPISLDIGTQTHAPISLDIGTQTRASRSANNPTKMKKLHTEISNLQEENIMLRSMLLQLREEQSTHTNFEKLCDKFLPAAVANFVKVQLTQFNKNHHGRRYTEEFKKFALSLYFVGPKCYRQLQITFALPSKRILEKYLEKLQFTTGLNNNLFSILKIKVNNMSELDKFCIICVDEISIKCNLYYDYGRDEVIGFEDSGIVKTCNPANYATVIMARGIKQSWKQPLGYMFSTTGMTAPNLKVMIHNFIKKLVEIGLTVVGLVTDMGSNFQQLANILGVRNNNSKIVLGDLELFYIFDPPHLLKSIRNNMLTYQFHWENKKTSWSFIEQFYNKDKELNNRLAPKLTKSHIYPTNFERMRVKYATQVLSATVSAGMETHLVLGSLPEDAAGTIDFISFFDKLFDICNSSNLSSSKMFNKAFSGQQNYIDFLNTALEFLNQLKVISNEGKNTTSYVKCIKGWKITINSLINIWTFLKEKKFSFILTRRFNQDCLENFFGSIRQQSGNVTNPTPIQFARAFKKLFLVDYFHSEFMNCSSDFDNILTNSPNLSQQAASIIMVPAVRESFLVENCDYHEKSLPEQNAFKYVAGYLLNKCLQIHCCDICKKFANDDTELDASNLFIHYKAYNKEYNIYGALKTPHESFYNFVFSMETMFFSNIKSLLPLQDVGKNLLLLFKDIVGFSHPCTKFPLEYLLKLFIRLRIYYVLKNSNRSFKTCIKRDRKVCILMNM